MLGDGKGELGEAIPHVLISPLCLLTCDHL